MSTPDSGSKTASIAAKLLVEKGVGFIIPTARQKKNLVVACAKQDKIVYGKAFDVLRITGEVDLDSLEDVEAKLKQILICEIKSTRKDFNDDFKGYFFALTAAEVLVAQSLKDQFRFIFVNTINGAHMEMRLNEVFARARGIYPTWSIMF